MQCGFHFLISEVTTGSSMNCCEGSSCGFILHPLISLMSKVFRGSLVSLNMWSDLRQSLVGEKE